MRNRQEKQTRPLAEVDGEVFPEKDLTGPTLLKIPACRQTGTLGRAPQRLPIISDAFEIDKFPTLKGSFDCGHKLVATLGLTYVSRGAIPHY